MNFQNKLKVSSIEAAVFVVGIGFMIIGFLYSGYLSRGGSYLAKFIEFVGLQSGISPNILFLIFGLFCLGIFSLLIFRSRKVSRKVLPKED